MQIYVVAADWGDFEGWRKPVGAFTDSRDAYAAIGMALLDGRFDAGQLRVVPLTLNAPLAAFDPHPKPVDLLGPA